MSRMDRDKIINARAARNNLDMSQSLYIIILNQIHFHFFIRSIS